MFLSKFLVDEDGAVTTDWVVLTAAIVGLGLAVVASLRSGAGALGTDISTALTSASVATLGTLGAGGASGDGIIITDPGEPMPEPEIIPLMPSPPPVLIIAEPV
ncbi:MAG: hypothetical protein H6898_01940 [Rhodobacter sp.]|nr:hypothetical protein [Paracoccaceae bacterium]MCC0075333.1 hypothetical protein [Rhodobacter sp.]